MIINYTENNFQAHQLPFHHGNWKLQIKTEKKRLKEKMMPEVVVVPIILTVL